MPDEPLSQAMAGAIALHELFLSLTGAGFSEAQALELVKHSLTLGLQGHKPADPPPNRDWTNPQKES